MTVTVKKIGGSVAVLIPKSLARDFLLVEGTSLEVTSEDGAIQLRKKNRRVRRPLAEIVAEMNPAHYKRRAQEFADTVGDRPVGKEIW